MPAAENKFKQYRLGLIVSGLLNIVLITVLLFITSSSNGGTAVAAATIFPEEIALQPSFTATILSPTATATSLPAALIAQDLSPTLTVLPTATAAPTVVETAVPTEPLVPTATLSPTPTAQPTAVPGPDWLRYYNQFRTQSGLPQLVENSDWSAGSIAHSQYMILNSLSIHAQDPNKPGYSPEGDEAGQNGNIAISGWEGSSELWAIDYWMTAPFHAVPMLNPHLSQTGFGVFRDANSSFKMTATLDVSSRRELAALSGDLIYPLTYPQDGGEIWVLSYTLPEFPNPLTACNGLQKPTGPPLILQIGDGNLVPSVTQSSLTSSDGSLAHCIIDETRYVNSSQFGQAQGRSILDKQDAIVLIPAQPFTIGETYTASITVNGETITWSFTAVSPPTDY